MRILVFLFTSIFFLVHAQAAPRFDHMVIVVLENTNFDRALSQPYLKQLADRGALFTNFTAVTHPSQGNYIAMTAGTIAGVRSDRPVTLDVRHVGDLLEARRLSWKNYAEEYPGNCYLKPTYHTYARKHVPFLSFKNVQQSRERCQRVAPATEFALDIANHRLPNFSLFVPDNRNNGHDTGVRFADQYLAVKFGPLLDNPAFMRRTLFVLTFDENHGKRGNQIYTVLLGPMVKPGTVVNTPVNFYSLLRLVEDNWNLGNLGAGDVGAPRMDGFWR